MPVLWHSLYFAGVGLILKAMILAAGFGKRLRPFTDTTPKPLLPTPGGETLLDRHLARLAQAGVREVMINVAHLGEKIVQHVGNGHRYGLRVEYAREPADSPLETGGAVQAVLPWFAGESFLLLAADIWTDFPWQNLMGAGRWATQGDVAHLVLVPTPSWCAQHDFCYVPQTKALLPRSAGESGYGYAGFGVFTPSMWEGFAPGFFPLHQVIASSFADPHQSITASVYHGAWFNIGDQARLEELALHCAEQG